MYAQQKTLKSVVCDSGLKMKAQKINNSADSSNFARNFYDGDIDVVESFYVMILSRNHTVKFWAKIGQGGIASCVVDVRVICKHVVDNLGSVVILIHNHPSGNLEPSKQDKDLTSKIKQALSFFDVALLDHIILTEESYFSFADNNLI